MTNLNDRNVTDEKYGDPGFKIVRNACIPILSFFTGAGFLDLGFRQSGFNAIWHNEYSAAFVSGFEHGMASLGLSNESARIQATQSILEVSSEEIIRSAFKDGAIPECFGVIGGPPCPDFSVGGKNRGSKGENGRLTEVFANRILEIRPSFFLLENVPGLLRTSKHREFLASIMEHLGTEFFLDLRILNALEYGVPQDRERIFLFGLNRRWLKRKSSENLPTQDVKRLISKARSSNRTLGEPLDSFWFPWEHRKLYWKPKNSFVWPDTDPFGSSPDRPSAPIELMVGPLLLDSEATAMLPNGMDCFVPYSAKFHEIPEGDVSGKSFKRLHRWRFSPAAAYGNNEVHLHPTEPRRINVREAMRIQTVPDAYSLPSSMPLSAKFKTVANGVPVKLASAVASSIRLVLDGVENGTLKITSDE